MKMAIKVENVDVSVVGKARDSIYAFMSSFSCPRCPMASHILRQLQWHRNSASKWALFASPKSQEVLLFWQGTRERWQWRGGNDTPLATEYIYQIIIKLQIAVCYTNEVKLADAWLLLLPKTAQSPLRQTNKGTHLIGHQAITGLSVLPKGAAAGELPEKTWIKSKKSLGKASDVEWVTGVRTSPREHSHLAQRDKVQTNKVAWPTIIPPE